MTRTRGVSGCWLLLTGALICAPVTAAAMTEQELCDLYLRVTEDAVTVFEPIWVDDSARVPNSGFYDFSKYNDWNRTWYAAEITVPGTGMVVFCYSVLLNETDQQTFTDQNVPRATLLDHAIKAIRWCCLTSAYVDKPYPFPIPNGYPQRIKDGSWVRPYGHRTDVMGWLTVGTFRLWDHLDDETKRLVEKMMIGAAPTQRLVYSWDPRGQGGNHDQVKQDLASTIGAAFMFPHRPDAKQYLDVVRGNGIDLVSTLQDKNCNVVADGKPVREWSRGWNLYQDYSSDHHGWAQIWYGCEKMFEGRCYVEFMSRIAGIPMPEVFTYDGNGYDGVLEWIKTLCLPEGEPASVHGMEYDAYYGAGMLAYCYGATVKKDPVAAALEEQAARLLERHTRAVRCYDYHRNSHAKAAAAYLMHKYDGPRAEPLPFDEAWSKLDGTYHYRWQQNLIHRDAEKWASFSWGTLSGRKEGVLCGFVVPTRGLRPDPEPLVYLHPRSLIGEVSIKQDGKPVAVPRPETLYCYSLSDAGFHTAGVASDPMLDRYYAFWSFHDGPCVMWTLFKAKQPCTLSWSGLPVYFYVRPGLTGKRQYYDAEGTRPLEQAGERKSNWWCVNEMLGLAAVGGNAQVRIERSVGNNWARTDAYRDKCDGVFISPISDRPVEVGEAVVDLATVMFVHPTRAQMTERSRDLEGSRVKLTEGWVGLVVPDKTWAGKRYLAVANLREQQTQTALELSFPEGAPILSTETTITGNTARSALGLAGSGSHGEVLELYAQLTGRGAVQATKETHNRYRLEPVRDEQVELRLTYCGRDGRTLQVRPAVGGPAQRITIDASDQTPSYTVRLAGPTYVEIEGPGYDDTTAPAVEIADLDVREDGRVTITVAADDQSGIDNLTLYCDGTSLGTKSATPYTWVHRPGDGAHTYQAVAADASPKRSERRSFKRTVEVGARTQW